MRASLVLFATLALSASAAPAWAVNGGGSTETPSMPAPGTTAPGATTPVPAAPARDAGYTAAERAVKARQYEVAIRQLEQVLAREPRNVEAINYMAYSLRELGRNDQSLSWYQHALAINPSHRGVNEYLGQLYLRMGKIAEARAQLAKLERLCGRGCEEYESLRAALPRGR